MHITENVITICFRNDTKMPVHIAKYSLRIYRMHGLMKADVYLEPGHRSEELKINRNPEAEGLIDEWPGAGGHGSRHPQLPDLPVGDNIPQGLRHQILGLNRNLSYVDFSGLFAINFEIEITRGIDDKDDSCNGNKVASAGITSALGRDLEKEMNDPTFSDATLICNGREFPCHRVMLWARSSVFKNMFTHKGFTECENGRVDITDMNPETLEHMIKYIYTDTVDENANYSELFVAADKYDIPGLHSICETKLCNLMEVGNAAELFRFASMHGGKKLVKKSMEFITENVEEAMNTPGWSAIRSDVAAVETILKFACR